MKSASSAQQTAKSIGIATQMDCCSMQLIKARWSVHRDHLSLQPALAGREAGGIVEGGNNALCRIILLAVSSGFRLDPEDSSRAPSCRFAVGLLTLSCQFVSILLLHIKQLTRLLHWWPASWRLSYSLSTIQYKLGEYPCVTTEWTCYDKIHCNSKIIIAILCYC